MDSPSNWLDATRRLLERRLECPHCQADNLDSRHIQIRQDGIAVCDACSHSWPVGQKQES
jgi:transcription elongation factor Elf1